MLSDICNDIHTACIGLDQVLLFQLKGPYKIWRCTVAGMKVVEVMPYTTITLSQPG